MDVNEELVFVNIQKKKIGLGSGGGSAGGEWGWGSGWWGVRVC